MRYIMRVVEKPVLYRNRKNNQTHAYTTEKLHKYRSRFPRRYVRSSSLTKSLESHYIPIVKSNLLYKKARKTAWRNSYLFPKPETQLLNEKTCGQYLYGWKRLFCQDPMTCSKIFKEEDLEKSKKMKFVLMELKTAGNHYGFLVIETTTNRIVEWEDLPDVDMVQEYLRKHIFPEDKYYFKETFLEEIEMTGGHICLLVEKRETAEFICRLCCELIQNNVERGYMKK